MAFDNEEEARDYAETLRPCVRGSLEVVPLKFEPARDVANPVKSAPPSVWKDGIKLSPEGPKLFGQAVLP